MTVSTGFTGQMPGKPFREQRMLNLGTFNL